MGWLDDTNVLITGAGSGLGRALVTRFIAEGANVGVLEINTEKAGVLRDEFGDRIAVTVGDACSFDDNTAAVAATVTAFGGLDTFIGNAGVWDYSTPLERLKPEVLSDAFDEVFRLNVLAYMLGAKASLEELRKSNGSMIFTASNAAFWPSGGGPLYVASKHAVVGLVKQLAYELAPDVRVNAIAPGPILEASVSGGDMSVSSGPDETEAEAPALDIPLARWGEAADIADAVLYLVRDARYTTGATLPVDGGRRVIGY